MSPIPWVRISEEIERSAIAGSRDPAHARANADAGDVALDPQTLAELDAIVSEGSAAI